MRTSFAIVHHANQYLITTGYDNREGIEAVVGNGADRSGFTHILRLHEQRGIPLNLHISGTLLEAIAWHVPDFLHELRRLLSAGLIELVGSSYGQNIMRFFGSDYNRRQLNEELLLYKYHLGIDPNTVKTFWPPERVWETRRMAPLLRDAKLLNDGYRYVILDDRLLLDPMGPLNPRKAYDQTGTWDADLFRMHEIEDGLGLLAFPIGTRLRRSIPPRQDEDWKQVQADLEAILVHGKTEEDQDLLAVYADDMEKVAGVGEWGGEGPARYEVFLDWINANRRWIRPVRLQEWAASTETSKVRRIELGTFQELAVDFEAGEGYEQWYLAADWAPYRRYFTWAESKVKEAIGAGGSSGLLELADKQLLVANWETAWHTPASGPHGDAVTNGHASPWARALTSHSRHAAVTAEAAIWMTRRNGTARALQADVDNDDEREIVLKNKYLYALISPQCGGRLVSLFSVSGHGAMVVGNPCDDWNWLEDLNRYMDVPRNHPGAFADVGMEHESFTAEVLHKEGTCAAVRLTAANGLTKEYELGADAPFLRVRYMLPASMPKLSTECGLSPDYLQLLRCGADCLQPFEENGARGCGTGSVAVWLRPESGVAHWETPYQDRFGHGCMFRIGSSARTFTVEIGVTMLESAVGSSKRQQG